MTPAARTFKRAILLCPWGQIPRARRGQTHAPFPYSPIINHIGSTAIPDIQAKPIVDILVEVSPEIEWQPIMEILEHNGYIRMSESGTRISFNKGYTPAGSTKNVRLNC